MILAANDVRDLHLEVVDHVDKMKNPRAIRTPDGHVGMRFDIVEIELNLAADEIIDYHGFPPATKAQSSLILEDVAGGEEHFKWRW